LLRIFSANLQRERDDFADSCRSVYSQLLNGQTRPSDLRYFFVFLSPILGVFFFTVSVDRPNLAATLAVGLLENSFLSKLASLFDHRHILYFSFLSFFGLVCLQPYYNQKTK
jgi:hypothetical protein